MAGANDIIIRLSHELSVVMEMNYEPEEMTLLWADALDVLQDSKQYLSLHDLPISGVVENILKITGDLPSK